MNITRRTFIGGVAAAMGGVVLGRDEVLANPATATPAMWVEKTHYASEFLAALIIEGRGTFAIEDFELSSALDAENAKRYPTLLSIKHLRGTYADLLALYELTSIEHQLDAVVVCAHCYQPQLYPPQCLLGCRLRHPVVTSLGMAVTTLPNRIDADGHNGGQDIVLKPHERMAVVTDLEMMSIHASEELPVEMLSKLWQQSQDREPSDPYRLIEAWYAERRQTQTPEERAAEDQRVRAYADNNRDQTAWERAADELKDFDPQLYRRSLPK